MSVRRIRNRLHDAGRRLRDRDYARLAAYWHGGVRPDEEARVERLFGDLAAGEAADGTPLEAVLGRLPPGLALEIRRALGARLAERDAPPRLPDGQRRDG